jgi:hypothetical protein
MALREVNSMNLINIWLKLSEWKKKFDTNPGNRASLSKVVYKLCCAQKEDGK